MNINKRNVIFVVIVITMMMLTLSSCVRRNPNLAPSAVINIYPVQSELVDENYFYGKWTKSVDPEGGTVKYKFNYAQTVEGLDDPQFFDTSENYFLLPNLEEGVWYWRVTAIDNAGNETKSPVWSFTINGETLPQPVNVAELPPDPSLIVSNVEYNSFTLDWPEYQDNQNPNNEIVYNIYVYEQAGESQPRTTGTGYFMVRTGAATTVFTTDTSHTFQNMKTETYYDWTVVAQNNASQTIVVGSSQVRTGNRSPSAPVLISPVDEAIDVATNVTLDWEASVDPDGDALKYYVYMDTVNNTYRVVCPVEGIDETNYTPGSVEEGRTYYWFIMVKDSNGAATRTGTRDFTTVSPDLTFPATPTPINEATGIDTTEAIELSWQHDQEDREITYNLYFSKNPRSLTLKAEDLNQKTYTINEYLNENTWYYWQVEAVDVATGRLVKSPLWRFKTDKLRQPVQTDAVTNTDGTQILMTFDLAMKNPTGMYQQFTVKADGRKINTSRVEIKVGTINQFLLTLEQRLSYGQTITMDYDRGMVQSAEGAYLESYSDFNVRNVVPGDVPVVQSVRMITGENATTSNLAEVQFNMNMKAPDENAVNQFSVQADGRILKIESASRKAEDISIYYLTLKDGNEVVYGESISLNYTKGTVQASNEAWLESFAGQQVTNTVNPVPPVLLNAQTDAQGYHIEAVFDKDMIVPNGEIGNMTVSASGNVIAVQNLTIDPNNDKQINIELSDRIEHGEPVLLSYAGGDINSGEGAKLAAFSDAAVTNDIPEEPQALSAVTNGDGKEITVTFDKKMDDPQQAEDDFILNIERVNDKMVSRDSIRIKAIIFNSSNEKQLELTLEEAIDNGDTATISYTSGNLESQDKGWLQSFEKPIENNVIGEAPKLESATMTENGTQLIATFDMKMEDNPFAKEDQFAIRVNGVERKITAIATNSSEKQYCFTIAQPAVLWGETVSLVYIKGTIKAKYGTFLESFTREAANLVPPLEPIVQSVETNTRGNWVYVTFDKELKAPVNQQGSFRVEEQWVASIQRVAPEISFESATLSTDKKTIGLELSLANRVAYGEDWNLIYTPGLVETTASATLATFTERVTNNTPVEPTIKEAYTSTDGNTVSVLFSKDMKTEPSTDGFDIQVHYAQQVSNQRRDAPALTIDSIERDPIDDRLYNLSLSEALNNGDVATLTYTRQYDETDVESLDNGWLKNATVAIRDEVPPDAPLFKAATMTADGRCVEIGFDREMKLDDPDTQYDQFGILVEGRVDEINSIALKTGDPKIIVLTLAIPIGKNNDVYLSYTRGRVKATNDGELESFQNKPVNTDNLEVILVAEGIRWNYSKIQEAIDDAEDEATIMVWPGTYQENIDFKDKEIHLSSSTPTDATVVASTVINPAEDTLPIVTINDGQTTASIMGFWISGNATAVLCESTTPLIQHNMIESKNAAFNAVVLNQADATLYLNVMTSAGTIVCMDNAEPIIKNNGFLPYKSAIEINGSTPTVYDNLFDLINGDGIYVNADSSVKNKTATLWRAFNLPIAELEDIEQNTNADDNDTFRNSDNTEGKAIKFVRAERVTKEGTFTLSPATATSNDGENFTIVATYTLAEYFSNGTVTYTLDTAIDLDNVHITVNGERRAVTAEEIVEQSPNKINISGIRGSVDSVIVLEIVQRSYMDDTRQTIASAQRSYYRPPGYPISIAADRDGAGSLYSADEPATKYLNIYNKLESIGDEDTAYEIKDNGDSFRTWTVKIFKDELPTALQSYEATEWQIKIDGDSYSFRENEFDANIFQCDDIPNNTGIDESDIKNGTFEPEPEI
ncbi:MAG: hypothetical protein JEY79_18635 [Pseudodesulfovibrio sp.]|nr:hypothetical protein [Pseudodesulfovibrio sp.]